MGSWVWVKNCRVIRAQILKEMFFPFQQGWLRKELNLANRDTGCQVHQMIYIKCIYKHMEVVRWGLVLHQSITVGGGGGGGPPPLRRTMSRVLRPKIFLLHFRTLERILRGSCEKKITVWKIFTLGSHVRVTVSPQPYDLIQHTIYHYDLRRGYNNFLSYYHTYKHSYKKLQGRFTTHPHDFQFWYLSHISAVVHIHEWRYSSNDRSPRAQSFTLLHHPSITFPSKVIKGSLIFL